MAVKIGINGFGRIGRLVARAALAQGNVEIVGINDLTDAKTSAHLFKYDSVHGIYKGDVKADGNDLVIDGKKIPVSAEKDPANLKWDALGAEVVVESTGFFTDRDKAAAHLGGSVKKVIISAPAKGADLTVVVGVNDNQYDASKHHVLSNASCTTNCLAPVVKALHEKFGVKRGLMNTIHSYTNDQRILDFPHSDLRRARAAALSMIPTKTGAAAAIGLVIPELNGKLDGFSIRVPTPNVSVVDLTAELATNATVAEINAVVKEYAEGPLKGILQYCDEPLVSSDFNGNPHSSNCDAPSTRVIDGSLVKILSWYDNEWGFSNRVIDLIGIIAK
ncbi:MAG: type I glyceraldehyde-3-phosphate dehydrogenase [bacterium]|jgi:glyceraldehyde 3-phosphate dehydrogenase|nr:type I glyceraldehyde-3-phosphate dehydrogenase [bacterium]